MTTLVNLVMEAAAIGLLHEEAAEIDQEVQRLLSEIEQATDKKSYHSLFFERFMELLKRREEVARKTVIVFEKSRDRSALSWLAVSFHGNSASASASGAREQLPQASLDRVSL